MYTCANATYTEKYGNSEKRLHRIGERMVIQSGTRNRNIYDTTNIQIFSLTDKSNSLKYGVSDNSFSSLLFTFPCFNFNPETFLLVVLFLT